MKKKNIGGHTRVVALIVTFGLLCGTSIASPVYDFDGDGTADFAVRRNNGSGMQYTWHMLGSQNGYTAANFGYQFPTGEGGDSTAAADFDGDGKTDLAVVRRTALTTQIYWYILNSSNGTVSIVPWGIRPSDIAVPQDYDGDGQTDIAIRRGDYWWILRSSDGQPYVEHFVGGSDSLQGGDYDGDGKDDLATVRVEAGPPGESGSTILYVKYSSTGQVRTSVLGDARVTGVVTGDYDGDGRADVAKRQGTLWNWERSSDGQIDGFRFGADDDYPMPDDYNGDGKTDVAIFRQYNRIPGSANNYYMIMEPNRAGYRAVPWSISIDTPIFDRRYVAPAGF